MEYLEHRPPTRLAPFVRCLWTLAGPAGEARAPQPVVPDGCMEVVFNLADPFERYDVAGRFVERQPRELIVGPTTGPVVIVPTGAVDLIGVRFHPWGAAAFLAMPPAALRDQLLPLGNASSELGHAAERLRPHAPPLSRTATLIRALEAIADRRRTPDPALRAALGMMVSTTSPPSLRTVAARLGRSVRWVQRAFGRDIGLGPKMLMRIARVQRAMRFAERSPGRRWAAVAAEAGYFDHSHLVRDFRQLVGCTPSELEVRAGALTEAFLEPATSYRTPLHSATN